MVVGSETKYIRKMKWLRAFHFQGFVLQLPQEPFGGPEGHLDCETTVLSFPPDKEYRPLRTQPEGEGEGKALIEKTKT